MADPKQFLVDIQLNKNQLLNPVIHNSGVAPSLPKPGQLYFDNDDTPDANDNKLFLWNGTSWLDITTGRTDLTYTASSRTIHSSSGDDVILPLANATNAGLMSSGHFNILNGYSRPAAILTPGTGIIATSGNYTPDNSTTFNLDFSELNNITADISGTTQFILQEGAVESRKAASGIKLSIFNNDLGWTATTGIVETIVSNTTNQLTVGGTAADVTLSVVTGAVANGSTVLPTADHVYDFVLGLGYTTNAGTVTSIDVNSGTGIDVSPTGPITSSGAFTVAIDYVGANNFIAAAPVNLEGTALNALDTILYNDVSDGAGNIKRGLVSDLPFISDSVDVTPVTLTGTGDYLSLTGQQLTKNPINLGSINDITGTLPIGNLPALDEDDMNSNSALHVATQQSIVAYVGAEIAGAISGQLNYVGGYDADSNTPDLDVSPVAGITKGDTYTVTVAGDFFTEAMSPGDVIIAEQDNPTTLEHWTRVNKNIPDLGAPGDDGSTTRRLEVLCTAGTLTTINHTLGTRFVQIQVYNSTSGDQVTADVKCVDETTATVEFNNSVSVGAYTIVLVG